MAKKGKALEQLVAAIQEVVKDCPNTIVQTNVNVPNTAGINREIDILVSTKVQGICNCTAFECKDYSTSAKSKPVDIQVVDAFIGKCSLIPSINQKVIVSATGFSKNAIKEAEMAGVKLYAFENIPIDEIISKGDAYFVRPTFKIKEQGYVIYTQKSIKIDSTVIPLDHYFDENNTKITTDTLFKSQIRDLNMETYSSLVAEYLKRQTPFRCRLSCKPHGGYVLDSENNRHNLKEIVFLVEVNMKLAKGSASKQDIIQQGDERVTVTEYTFKETTNSTVVINTSKSDAYYVKNEKGELSSFEYTKID